MRVSFDGLSQDVRDSIRTFRSQRTLASAAVLMLGLGIGATTAIFSVVNAVLLEPLPYAHPGALVRIVHSIGGVDQPYFSDRIYLAYVDNTLAFEDLGVWTPGDTATITGRGEPEEVRALTATRGVLTTLGVPPILGRWFSPADDRPGAPDVVMLGGGYWQRRFGGDRRVLGETLTVNGRPHQIVGVMPPGFRVDGDFDVVLPLRIDRGAPLSSFRLLGVARLAPGVTLAAADRDVARVLGIWFDDSGVKPDVRARWAPALRSLVDDVLGDTGRSLWPLMGAVSIVLLMACASAANLLLARAEGRRRELAIRAALGASRARLARHLLVESLSLAVIGGVVGVELAAAAVRVLVTMAPAGLPRVGETTVDRDVLVFAAVVSLVSGVIFGLPSVVQHVGRRMADTLGAIRDRGAMSSRHRLQHALVIGQVALALMLLVSAGLMIRSVQALGRVDPGFTEPERLQTFGITIPDTVVAEAERVTRMQHDLIDRIAAVPGVTAAAFTSRLPMAGERSSAALTVEGRADAGRTPANRQVKIVSPGLFAAQGTPLVGGRDFTWSDVHGLRRVAIVSENLARELWGSPSAALGRRVREYYDGTSPWREIVGVAADVHDDGVDRAAPATIYWPVQPDDRLLSASGYQARRISIVMRSDRAGTAGLLAEMQQAVWSVGPTLPLAQVRTLAEVYRQSMARAAFALVVLATAGMMALLLGVFGVYGLVAYVVSRRRQEIGIRMALGARAVDIRRLFVGRAVLLASTGVAIGLAASAALTRSLQSLLFGVSPLDPVAFVVVPCALLAVVTAASYVPARRAAAVDPVEALKD